MTSVIMLSHITHRSTPQIQNQKWRDPSQNTPLSTDHTDPMPLQWTMIARITQCPYSEKPKHLWVPGKRKRPTLADAAISPRLLTYVSYTRNRKEIYKWHLPLLQGKVCSSVQQALKHRIKIKPQNGVVDAMPMSVQTVQNSQFRSYLC